MLLGSKISSGIKVSFEIIVGEIFRIILQFILCSYHVLTSSVRYQSTDARQNEIYLLSKQ